MWTPDPSIIVTAEQRAAEQRTAQIVPLTPRQLRLVMVHVGLSESDIMTHMPNEPEARIEWEWANSYDRNHWLVEHLREAMEFDADEFDDLWIWGASL